MRRCLGVITTLAVLAGAMALASGAPARAERQSTAARGHCGRGLAALTFDDGPQPGITPRVIRVLVRHHVPATFFLVGQEVRGHGQLLRKMHRHGFRVGNHSYHHENLTTLSNRQIRHTLSRTSKAIRHAGLPRPVLMRPPYGAINNRVSRVIHHMHLHPVLWTDDSRDWDGRSAKRIISTVLSELHRGRNIVLLHDGVANSDQTLAALPRLIHRIRGRGYCLAALSSHGVPQPPEPKIRVSGDTVRERGHRHPVFLRFHVRLSTPTSRPVSVRVRTRGKTATAHHDFVPRHYRLRFPAGATHRVVKVKVLGNAKREHRERIQLVLSRAHHARIADHTARGIIRDDD